MTADIRIVGATAIVASPTRVLWDAEIALSPSTGLITYLGRAGPTVRATFPRPAGSSRQG